MRFSSISLFASTAAALSFPDTSVVTDLLGRRQTADDTPAAAKCPAVWTTVSTELTKKFLSGGQCNSDARAAIRLVFHDCSTWNTAIGNTGGCDGSLVLNDEENARSENTGLQKIAADVKALATKYAVSVADMVVFAGTHAIVTCPGGPRVKTWIGRESSSALPPNGLLPDVNAPAANLSQLFIEKGFSDADLAALLGAHSTSTQFTVNVNRPNASQDSTPGIWDVKYYSETQNPPADILVFPSDSKLAKYAGVGKAFQGFVNNQGKWNGKFADAMGRMILQGRAGTTGMVDCTSALPQATAVKREMRAMNPFMPRH